MTELAQMRRAYREWCKSVFPNFEPEDFPYSERMWLVWQAAWTAAKGDSK